MHAQQYCGVGNLREFLQQCLGLQQVSGVKNLGEPALDVREQLPRFGTLALLLSQAREAHGGPQLQGFGLLAAGNLQGPVGHTLALAEEGNDLSA